MYRNTLRTVFYCSSCDFPSRTDRVFAILFQSQWRLGVMRTTPLDYFVNPLGNGHITIIFLSLGLGEFFNRLFLTQPKWEKISFPFSFLLDIPKLKLFFSVELRSLIVIIHRTVEFIAQRVQPREVVFCCSWLYVTLMLLYFEDGGALWESLL